MQLLPNSTLQDKIATLKKQRGSSLSLNTVRGRIFDRKARVLAYDEPVFQLNMTYELSCWNDTRVLRAKTLHALAHSEPEQALETLHLTIEVHTERLQQIIDKCIQFGVPQEVIEQRLQQQNDQVWNIRTFQAWRKNCTTSPFFLEHSGPRQLLSVKVSEAVQDFEHHVPDPNTRLVLIQKTDIQEMHRPWPLFELKTDDDVLAAQLEFMDIPGVSISAQPVRRYPYHSVGAQTIGWVGPATQEQDTQRFAHDPLASYLDGEVCGREDGVEYVCEHLLRGRRGEVVMDIDRNLINRIDRQFGQDIYLTIDIQLQQKIETFLTTYPLDPGLGPGMAVVVIDVPSSEILALVSLPVYDLNLARYEYNRLVNDPNRPLIHRALNKHYPPGSIAKPLILTAALQEGDITPDEVISCPSQPAPAGWPNCLLFRRNHMGHDDIYRWPNNARNAIKGSCNIYFSRLAYRLEPQTLQSWLYRFGFGHRLALAVPMLNHDRDNHNTSDYQREFRQAPGQISSIPLPYGTKVNTYEELPRLDKKDLILMGIGESTFWATPLQVANAMAILARNGLFITPRLFKAGNHSTTQSPIVPSCPPVDLNLSEKTIYTVLDGLYAVVNETDGTAYNAFKESGFRQHDVTVYGKTGSTESLDLAWFAGFARDKEQRCVAIALVVEGGQSGARHAAPLARDILQFCNDLGYIGKDPNTL